MSPNNPFNGDHEDPEDRENPLEELFRRLSAGQGLDPEALRGMGMPMDPAMMSGLFAQIQSMMGGMNQDGSVSWDHARQQARQIAAAEGDPSVSSNQRAAVRDAMQLAQLWLDPVTQLPRPGIAEEAWSRSEWVEHSFQTMREISEPVAASVAEAMGRAVQAARQRAAELGDEFGG